SGPLDERLRQQVVLRREVAVDGAECDARGLGDIAHLHCVVATVGTQVESRFDDATPPSRLALRQCRCRLSHRARTYLGSRGSPRTRSPTMLRWISSVPPPIDDCTALIHFCWKTPSASASGWSSCPYAPCMPIARSPSCFTYRAYASFITDAS